MGAWENYLAAAQRLDAARRDAATLVAERSAVAQTATKELATTRQRLTAQRARLIALAKRFGVPAPRVTTDATELAEARAALAGTGAANVGAAASALLRANRGTLDAADAELSTLDGPHAPAQLPGLGRNLFIYAVTALIATVIPVLTIMFAPDDPARPGRYYLFNAGGYCAAVVFPLIGYGLAWAIIGTVTTRPEGGRAGRNAALGALVTAAIVVFVYGLSIAAMVVG